MCDMKGVTSSDNLTNNYHVTAVPVSCMEIFNIIVLVFSWNSAVWAQTP